jgi:hypothetical protein
MLQAKGGATLKAPAMESANGFRRSSRRTRRARPRDRRRPLGRLPSWHVLTSISHRSQVVAVQWLTGWSLAEIDTLFSSHELPAPIPEESLDERRWAVVGSSVRRHLAARYHAAIDTRDPLMRARLLRAYDEIIRTADDQYPAKALIGALRADGVRFADGGHIEPAQLAIEAGGVVDEAALGLAQVRDPEVLREHARRMQRALGEGDPADAILAARELLESVCHVVIEDHGGTPPKNPSLGQLYGQAADLLGLRVDAIEGDSAASKAAKQVLGGLMSIANGMGELRTRVGRGHGRTTISPARQRHAELATNAAGTLALFVLDTWQDRNRLGRTAS